MNVERLEHLARLLDGSEPWPANLIFDMSVWHDTRINVDEISCNTVVCMAGLACEIWGRPEGSDYGYSTTAADHLGIDDEMTEALLFMPAYMMFATKDDAAHAIRGLIKTGIPDWSTLNKRALAEDRDPAYTGDATT